MFFLDRTLAPKRIESADRGGGGLDLLADRSGLFPLADRGGGGRMGMGGP